MKYIILALILGCGVAVALPRGYVKCPAVIADLDTGEYKSRGHYDCYSSAKYAKADGYSRPDSSGDSGGGTFFSGGASQNTASFKVTRTTNVRFIYSGSSNFIVILRRSSDGSWADLLVNEIGMTSGDTKIHVNGNYYFDVTASGAWTLAVG